jgi:hypothetical protein
MRYRLRAAANVVVGSDAPVSLKAGLVAATEQNAAALELLSTLGLAEPTEEEEHDAAQP